MKVPWKRSNYERWYDECTIIARDVFLKGDSLTRSYREERAEKYEHDLSELCASLYNDFHKGRFGRIALSLWMLLCISLVWEGAREQNLLTALLLIVAIGSAWDLFDKWTAYRRAVREYMAWYSEKNAAERIGKGLRGFFIIGEVE